MCNYEYIYNIKIRHHSFKETGKKIRKIEAGSDSDGGETHTY